MADYLILNFDHWMDKLSKAEIAERVKNHPGFQDKYDRRNQKGDIIEVQEDGYFKENQTVGGKFKVIHEPGTKKADKIHMMESLEMLTGVNTKGEPQYKTLRRHKYRIDIDTLDAKLETLTSVKQPTTKDIHEVEKLTDLDDTFIEKTEAAELAAEA